MEKFATDLSKRLETLEHDYSSQAQTYFSLIQVVNIPDGSNDNTIDNDQMFYIETSKVSDEELFSLFIDTTENSSFWKNKNKCTKPKGVRQLVGFLFISISISLKRSNWITSINALTRMYSFSSCFDSQENINSLRIFVVQCS